MRTARVCAESELVQHVRVCVLTPNLSNMEMVQSFRSIMGAIQSNMWVLCPVFDLACGFGAK